MKLALIISQLLLLSRLGHTTTVPPPNVRYLIVNKTSFTINKIIQIQSDTKDFIDVDTFAIASTINDSQLHLFTDRGKDIREFQKLIVYTRDTCYYTADFKLLPNWMGYKLTINPNSISLEQTSYFKIRKVISDFLIALLIVLIIKGLGYVLVLLQNISRIFVELIFINYILTTLIYFSPDLWLDYQSPFPLIPLIVFLSLFIGFSEYLLISRKLAEKNKMSILIMSLSTNSITIIIGLVIMIVLRIFGGIIINLP